MVHLWGQGEGQVVRRKEIENIDKSLCVEEKKREKRVEKLKEKKYCYEERRWQE